jgi:MFS family permease
MAYQGMIPVGSLLIGWLANSIGPRRAVCIEGVIGLISTVIFMIYRNKKNTGRPFTFRPTLASLSK